MSALYQCIHLAVDGNRTTLSITSNIILFAIGYILIKISNYPLFHAA